ncbi:MAG TPA: ABC transporter ATP-binding protein [Clostridia bacterium]|nr:MAG: ABC-type transporter ATP-binding protein EcsA [Firmicutes bacterium ADurb.Bin248]HOF99577.1 ABC transporter ATP-binding protein [Clostridia bacterium]HOS17752.1 ABC transporter ATP-binding protein [Clostridia bacterium]HPK14549.1 ABC transporter ATP-binding protein [Clostridia bacterium]
MLKIEGLTKAYGNKKAVDNLSLHIQKGEIYGFIGHNGAGKTTTLKSCAGILRFDAGEIFIDGISIKQDPIACKKRIAYIPDNPDLYEFLSGVKYLNFIADVYGVGKAEREARIAKYAALFELTGDLAQPVNAYSHGMKQKLALIAALIHAPSLMVMDEPFVGLDPIAAHALKGIMHEICASGGAIFFSTHVLEVAEKLCDRIAIIRQGRLVIAGPTDEVRGNSSLENVFLELEGENA